MRINALAKKSTNEEKFDGGKFVEPKTLIEDISTAPNHAGTRARFDPDGMTDAAAQQKTTTAFCES